MPSASTAAASVPAGSLLGQQEQAVFGELALLYLGICFCALSLRGNEAGCVAAALRGAIRRLL